MVKTIHMTCRIQPECTILSINAEKYPKNEKEDGKCNNFGVFVALDVVHLGSKPDQSWTIFTETTI